MRKSNSHLIKLWLSFIYILLIVTGLSVFRLSAAISLCLLALLAAAQTVCAILVKRLITRIKRDSASEQKLLEDSYRKKLNTMYYGLKKRNHAYKLLLKKYKKIEKSAALPGKPASSKTIPGSAYMLPCSDAEDTRVNLRAIAEDTVQEMSSFSKTHYIRIQLSAAQEEIPFTCSADRIRILFRNIIDNSIKYMNRPGTLVITLSFIGDDIFMIFKDDGEGLTSTDLTHIFELNYQGSNRVSGNGLGLAQAKAIVEFYHGTIFAKSSPGNGMAIYIQLPFSL